MALQQNAGGKNFEFLTVSYSTTALMLAFLVSWITISSCKLGYPRPDHGKATSTTVMDKLFFVSSEDWQDTDFDYIVIGTGFCGYAFVSRILEARPNAKILMLERGPFFLPTHFQALPLAFQQTVAAGLEAFPWSVSKATHEGNWSKWIHGVAPYFGGRSTKWSAWCPTPTDEEMEGWPRETINANKMYIEQAKKFLNVTPADRVFGQLQNASLDLFLAGRSSVKSANITRVVPAPLSLADQSKFSTVGPLLNLILQQQSLSAEGKGEILRVSINCVVKRIVESDGTAMALETSKGEIPIGKAKLILAMGTFPAATLMLNSFPVSKIHTVGSMVTTHIISAITARIPRSALTNQLQENELAAFYIPGVDVNSGKQFHIQCSMVSSTSGNIEAFSRLMPDVLTAATPQQLQDSKDSVLFVFAVLGEQNNPNNWQKQNVNDSDLSTNVLIQALEENNSVWATMEEAAYELLESFSDLEYYSMGGWTKDRPSAAETRRPGLVHEGSSLYIGDTTTSPVDLHYKIRNTTNIFVTGGGLWPRSGSWNPTLTMVSLTFHLADILEGQQ